MKEEVKVMMDEQTKLALGRLQEALEDLLSPLRTLNSSVSATGSSDAVQKVAEGLKRLGADMEDSADSLSRKLADIADAQASLYAKLANIVAAQTAMSEKIEKIVSGLEILVPPNGKASAAKSTAKKGKKPKALAEKPPKAKGVKKPVEKVSPKGKRR